MESPYPVDRITYEQLETGLRIDENDLEKAWRQHPELFHRVSKKLTLLISQRDEAKQDVAFVEAEVDEVLRSDARKNETKITEREVESKKLQDKGVIEAQRRLSRLNLDVAQFTALKESYLQRSYALKHLVELYLNEMYSEREPGRRGGDEMMDNRARQIKREAKKQREDDPAYQRVRRERTNDRG